jgi:uncharacterized protein (DUF2267 family)
MRPTDGDWHPSRRARHELRVRQFLVTVQQKAAISRHAAETAARATLETLAERLSAGEARDIAERLPPELVPYLPPHGDAEAFEVDEFFRRVAEREGVDALTAERHAAAVFVTLRRVVPQNEIDDMAAELSKDYEPLVAEAQGRFARLMSAEEFFQRVADRAGIWPAHAAGPIEAVLTTLAERIAGGEVADLIAHLSPELHPPLRPYADRRRKATRMKLEEFVRRVAQREGVDEETAREHTRGVFETLREAIGDREFLDVTAQLPAAYAEVGARP